jgi:GDP-mannose 6-dehydrogenase
MKISVLGVGYVGAVCSACLAALGHEVVAVDIAPEKVEAMARGRSPIVERDLDTLIDTGVRSGRLTARTDLRSAVLETEISLVCVGTPSAPDGSVAMEAVERVLGEVGRVLRDKPDAHSVVMRSTVPPGTAAGRALPILTRESGREAGQGLHYYSNPEFLREGSAVADFHAPAFTLIGAAEGDEAAPLKALYAPIAAPVFVVPWMVAESVKYLSNAFHALKVAFANEAGAVLAACGVDARVAFRIFCEDRALNISSAYLRPGFAFGGSCLPKDVRSFLALAAARGVPAPLLGQILPSNTAVIERALGEILRHGRQRVALLGLAFKPGTDDLRESPFVVLAERLIGKGYELRVFDRSVELGRLTGANRAYIAREIPHIERLMTGSVAEAVADAGIVVVGHVDAADRPALVAALNGQTVLDLAGVPELGAAPGIAYRGICW